MKPSDIAEGKLWHGIDLAKFGSKLPKQLPEVELKTVKAHCRGDNDKDRFCALIVNVAQDAYGVEGYASPHKEVTLHFGIPQADADQLSGLRLFGCEKSSHGRRSAHIPIFPGWKGVYTLNIKQRHVILRLVHGQ